MGKSNVNVSLRDGLYYVHYDSMNLYRSKTNPNDLRPITAIPKGQQSKFNFDKPASQWKYDKWLDSFCDSITKLFPSFQRIDRYEKTTRRFVMENTLFSIVIEDNGWGFAIELIANPKCPYPNLQNHHFDRFFTGIRTVLLNSVDTIYVRTGSWTAQPFTKADTQKLQDHIDAAKVKLDPRVKATGGYNDDFKREIPTSRT